MHRQLLLHLDVAHAIGEGRDDGFLGHLGDLEARTVEALDVLLQVSPGCCLMRRMSLTVGGRSRVPWKLAMKRVRIWSQEEIVPGARFRSQVRAPCFSAMGNQFAMTFTSPLAASMPSS